ESAIAGDHRQQSGCVHFEDPVLLLVVLQLRVEAGDKDISGRIDGHSVREKYAGVECGDVVRAATGDRSDNLRLHSGREQQGKNASDHKGHKESAFRMHRLNPSSTKAKGVGITRTARSLEWVTRRSTSLQQPPNPTSSFPEEQPIRVER